MANNTTVCVTGGSGYIASWLIRKLLQKGHVVHSTLRDMDDKAKIQLLKSLDGAHERLHLIKADIYQPDEFETAILGCEFVFHLATPLLHISDTSQYKDTTEASLAAARSILSACERARSMKRIIYTGSVLSASPYWQENLSGREQYTMDEFSWTPLDLPFTQMDEVERDLANYIRSKTSTEKELLNYRGERGVEIVSLVCGVVGGDSILGYVPSSMSVLISPLTRETVAHKQLNLLQELLGSLPLVHIDDVCEAHLFVMQKPSVSGRFLCASCYPVMQEIVEHFERIYPHPLLLKEVDGGKGCNVTYSSTKLLDLGFKYKYDVENIITGSIEVAKRVGRLAQICGNST